MKKKIVICPICSKKGNLDIPEDIIKQSFRGIVSMIVVKDVICDHSFLVYFDKDLAIRDYITLDYQVELPQLDTFLKKKEFKSPDLSFLDVDLIKINIYPILLAFILRGSFFRKNIIILGDYEFLNQHLQNFFAFISQNSFNINVSILSREKYNSNEKRYKDFLIFEDRKVIRDKDKIIDLKKLRIEKKIVQNFFDDYSTESCLIILRNELYKAYVLSKTISEFIKNTKIHEKISIIKINEYLRKVHEINIAIHYFDFLIEIVENFFETKVPQIYDNFIGFL